MPTSNAWLVEERIISVLLVCEYYTTTKKALEVIDELKWKNNKSLVESVSTSLVPKKKK